MLANWLASLRERYGGSTRAHLKRSQHIQLTNPWHAVGIVYVKPGCAACVSMKNVRFLAKEAPLLPLKNCNNPAGCKCVYKHYGDRRTGPRRTAERWSAAQSSQSAPGTRAVRENRRRGPGRRASDGR
jgi:hypothetical protein